jgi:hypothetical protein
MDFAKSHSRFWEEIEAKGADTAARFAGCRLDDGGIVVPLAGREFTVDSHSRTILARDGSPASFLDAVVLLTYLARADGTPLAQEWVSEKMLPLGDAYFRGPHLIPSSLLLPSFGADEAGFHRALARVEGTVVDYGDFGAEIPALPRVPMRIGIWKADDEFPAEVRVLFDATANRYLILDGILTLVNIVFKRLAS